VAWQWAPDGQKTKGILLMHLILGCISSVLIWLVFWIHWRVRQLPERSLPKYRLPIEALAVFIVGLTGHLGGFLSGGKRNPIDAADQLQRTSGIADVNHPASGGYLAIVDSRLEASGSQVSKNKKGPEMTQATDAVAAMGSASK